MIKVAMNADGKQWDVVRSAEVIAMNATITKAKDAKFELSWHAPRKVVGFRQDGTEITRRAG